MPPTKRKPPPQPRGDGQIVVNVTNTTISNGRSTKNQARNALRFCLRYTALLDNRDVLRLAALSGPRQRLHSWKALRGDAPGDVRFSTLGDHQLSPRQFNVLAGILLKIEAARRRVAETAVSNGGEL
jgi:hypothetical protein